MNGPMLRCASPAGTVLSLEAGALVIRGKSERRVLPAETIRQVRLDPPRGLSKGRLRVVTAEGEEEFSFRRQQYVQAATLQGWLSGRPSREEPDALQTSAPASVADELLKLKTLLDSGALTAGEFETAKRKLLK